MLRGRYLQRMELNLRLGLEDLKPEQRTIALEYEEIRGEMMLVQLGQLPLPPPVL